MSIKSITIRRGTSTKNGRPVSTINLEISMQEPDQQPTQTEALDMLAQAIQMIISFTQKG